MLIRAPAVTLVERVPGLFRRSVRTGFGALSAQVALFAPLTSVRSSRLATARVELPLLFGDQFTAASA
ncbi:hypothetical protein OHA40_10735 [Nocardia sp. NBC_00508]|uniref:hypothetical protein n=1 Tax=Nocardia sp. NBC_00508 TaxID=2975992 RepID=UPI002E8135AD|nr:hypothetical protein [Nocardia sp. NBC_00508]WUD68536.1 hypothetical protein OHA40_10735 [Nocardia sp. NBC_00508]